MDGWNTTFILGWPIFRGKPLVSGRVYLREPLPRLRHSGIFFGKLILLYCFVSEVTIQKLVPIHVEKRKGKDSNDTLILFGAMSSPSQTMRK